MSLNEFEFSMISEKQGVAVGEFADTSGMSRVLGRCGVGVNCSGGGGQCGIGVNCSGGGGQCGIGVSCSGS